MPFTGHAHPPGAAEPLSGTTPPEFPEPEPEPSLDILDSLAEATGPQAPDLQSDFSVNPHAYSHRELGHVPQPTLHPPPSLQPGAAWFRLGSPATGSSTPGFQTTVDPFLAHHETSIVDFASGVYGHGFESSSSGLTSPHLPLGGPGTAVDFHFDCRLPPWEPPFGDNVFLSGGAANLPPPDEDLYYTNTTRPEKIHASALVPEAPWLGEDEAFSTADRHDSQSFEGPARTTRKTPTRGKKRADSMASGSTYSYSTSVASTHEGFPFPDATSNPSNPLNTSSSLHNPDRRRRNRAKSRARSVVTTNSASSSSTAPTPSPASGTLPGHWPRPSTAVVNPQERPPTPTTSSSSRLRSASRASKNSVSRPSDTAEERRTRASHNLVEKQYRNRLNAQFEGLLGVLPDPGASQDSDVKADDQLPVTKGPGGPADAEQEPGDRKVSKAEVLERARAHIKSLERQNESLARKREALLESLARAELDMASSDRGRQEETVASLDIDDRPTRHWRAQDEVNETTKKEKEHEAEEDNL